MVGHQLLLTICQLPDGSTAFETLESTVNTLFGVTGDSEFRNEALAALYVGKRWLKHLFKANVGAVKMTTCR